MSTARVAPVSDDSDDLRILRTTAISMQKERQDVFTKKLDALPYANIVDVFNAGVRISASRPCLGTRADASAPYTWLSFQEVLTQAQHIGSFLANVLKLESNTFVGIYSKNRAEWVIFELGCFMFSLVPVPLYDTLGPDATDYILQQTSMSAMLCETPEHVATLKRTKNSQGLQYIVQITGRMPMVDEESKQQQQQMWSWHEAMKAGRDSGHGDQSSRTPERSSLALLCYTSGTTGLPKGVKITHGNLIAEALAMSEFLVAHGGSYVQNVTCEDVYLSYLPLAHIFERIFQVFCFMHGMRIGFYRGDVLTLADDMAELKPTIFCTVPRLLNRIYDKTVARAASNCFRSAIFRMALNSKVKEVSQGIIRKNSIWDSLVFGKVQSSAGGRIRLVIVGSAPLSEEVMRFSRAAFGCPVLEGYGQTETSAGTSATLPGNPTTGNVGVPLFSNIIQLQDVPEMDYYARDGIGEICIQGCNVTTGYYKLQEETDQAIDKSGWLHTGDVGQWTPDGFLKIVDRKKHIFKLSQGEYIAPEKIELVYCTNVYVQQVFVHGDSLESCVLAVVVPNRELVQQWARANGRPTDVESLVKNEELKAEILASMHTTGRNNGLKSFEQVKGIHLHAEPFSVENGLLTPTFKAVRSELKNLFGETFKRMYYDMKVSA